jgi:DNA replication protein DnaC
MRRQLILAGYESSGLGKLIATQRFDNFSLDYYKTGGGNYDNVKMYFSALKSFAEGFSESTEKSFLLIGGTGLGKTHLSTAIARCVIEKGYSVVYETVQTVFSDFEYDHFHSGHTTSKGKAERYLEADLLILDDLGTEFSTQFTLSCLYQLINTRLMRGLSTIISTNYNEQELITHYDSRLTSRFLGNYRILCFKGSDIRIQKLKER